MFGKKKEKEVKSYEYMVEYCIIGLMTQPATLHIKLKNPLKATKFNGEADTLFSSNKSIQKPSINKYSSDLVIVMGKIFASYAYMDLAEFKKRLVIISIEGGM